MSCIYMKELLLKILRFLFPWLFSKESTNHKSYSISYQKKSLLTNAEKEFYNKLKKIETLGDYKVIPQVNLACIIHKDSNYRYRNELFRNIDFGIFDSNFQVLLLIELNDSSHNLKSRKKRDIKINEILHWANIPIIRFYTSYPNEEKYVVQRVLSKIQSDLSKEE